MAKYLILWKSDNSKVPTDPKEAVALNMRQGEMTKQAMKEGKVTDWGLFPGGGGGYALAEGSALDVFTGSAQFMPYITFKVQEVLSIDEVMAAMKSMMP